MNEKSMRKVEIPLIPKNQTHYHHKLRLLARMFQNILNKEN